MNFKYFVSKVKVNEFKKDFKYWFFCLKNLL